MFFSEKKLRELANIGKEIKTSQIIDAINSIGFEVEDYEPFLKVKGLKFGQIQKCYKNPNSDKLNVCEIKFKDKNRIIQTTATNVKENDYIIAFVPGSKLGDITIGEKEMGKIKSEGMLASYEELGFNPNLLDPVSKDGVIILENVELDKDPIEYLDLDDNVIEVSILSNRSDAQCYKLFALELAAFFQTKVKDIKEAFNNKAMSKVENLIKISDKENNLNGVEIINENYKMSIKEKVLLLKTGISISEDDIVNFTNLVLIFVGVSIRAIDIDKLSSNNLKVKVEKEIHYLSDSKNNISILGVDVIKGFNATSNSKKILFEFSQIDQKIVRDNSKKSKLVTNSSINNSREISSGQIFLAYKFISSAFKKCSKLINEIKLKDLKIKFDKNYLNDYAGFDITKKPNYKKALNSLKILGFKFDTYVSCPYTRHDLKNMQNIVEEVFRFYGFNNFDIQPYVSKALIVNPINSIEKSISFLGYKQAWTYTLVNKERNEFNPFNFKENFNLLTFVSEEYNSIRNSIALTLNDVFEYNIKRKMENLSLFDIGMINDKKAIIIASNRKTFKQIKEDLEKITNQKFEIIPIENEWLHPNYNAGLYIAGRMVGWIGKFNPFKIESNVIFGEVLEECIYSPSNKFIEFDSSPLKERDITLSIEKDYEHSIYLNKIKSIEGIFSVDLISTFKKDNVNKLTYRVLMDDRALKEFESIKWDDKKSIYEL